MTSLDQILETLRTAKKEEIYSQVGEIISVNAAELTCDVQPISDDPIIYDVLLMPTDQAQSYVVPTVGAKCIITFLSKDHAYLAILDQVDRVVSKVGQTEVVLTSHGVNVSANNVNLKSVLDSLVDQIKLITVGTANGNSTTPINAAAFDTIKAQISQILIDS